MLQFSPEAISFLKALEGKCLTLYYCSAGYATIGYGHLWKSGEKKKITEIEAALLLKQDLSRFVTHVWNCCRDGGRLPNQHQFDAMVCLAFNIGEAGFTRSSVLRRFINHDDAGAAAAFLLWNKIGRLDEETGKRVLRASKSLSARRMAESRMFLLGYYDKTPYNSLDDEDHLIHLRLSRNPPEDKAGEIDDIPAVSAGESETRPTLKNSRTIKQTTVGGTSALVTGAAAAATTVKAVAEQVTASSESVKKAVEVTGDAANAAGSTLTAISALPLVLSAIMAAGTIVSIISFILVRRARKDDWRRGRR